ncbi:craniofacial development protein 2-like [Montipora capricornis]|uniref:craniofacial development protein 2-like n=1 Tax=Montipora capricornis TaxID=246305 RepID=UPI0035F21191
MLSGGVAAGTTVTLLGQSRQEAQRPIGPIVAPKKQTTIGCWNVRTMAEATRTAQVAKEMAAYGVEILGLSETRWRGMGSVTLESGEKVVYVGDDGARQGGVAIMMSARTKRALMEWTQISKRIVKARFYSKYRKLMAIQAYAPTNEAIDEEKDEFYNQLQDSISSCSRHDMIVVMGDLNAKVVEMAEINNISCEIRRRRWNWLRHVLRREDENDCFTALGWTPEGRRARGRPRTTCRRTVEKERDKAGWKSWNVAKAAARNREHWAKSVTALCAYWRKEK